MPLPERQYVIRVYDITDGTAQAEPVLTLPTTAPDPWCALDHCAHEQTEKESQ